MNLVLFYSPRKDDKISQSYFMNNVENERRKGRISFYKICFAVMLKIMKRIIRLAAGCESFFAYFSCRRKGQR